MLIIIVLLAAGNATLVALLCRSHAFAWLRRLFEDTPVGSLLACPFCTSCWTGLLMICVGGWVLHYPGGVLLWWPALVCFTSGWFMLIVRAYGSGHA